MQNKENVLVVRMKIFIRNVLIFFLFLLKKIDCGNTLKPPRQNTDNFLVVRMKIFIGKSLIFFLIFAQNIDCGNTLETPRRGGSNEYTQSIFWSKNKKIGVPPHTPVLLYN